MSENNENIPKIRFPGFTDAWEQRKLGDYTKLITKGTTPKDKSRNGAVNFVKIENIANGKISPITKITQEEHENYLKRSILEEHDILFSIAGTLGRTAVVDKSILPANTNQALAIIRGYDFDTDFLITSLGGQVVAEYIRKNPTIGAQPNLSLQQVGKLNVWTPGSDEQKKIGVFFASLDHLITLHQRKLNHLQDEKKSLLQKMFPRNGENVPELRFPGFTHAWEQRGFSEIVTRVSKSSKDGELPRIEYEDIVSGQGELNKDIFAKKNDKKGIEFEAGDTLFGKLRPYLQNWLLPDFKGIAVGDWWVLRPNEMDSKFIYSLIQSSKYQTVANLSTGTKMPRSDWKVVSTTEFTVPIYKTEQAKIGALFAGLDHLITLHQRKLDHCKNLKKSLLQQMFV